MGRYSDEVFRLVGCDPAYRLLMAGAMYINGGWVTHLDDPGVVRAICWLYWDWFLGADHTDFRYMWE